MLFAKDFFTLNAHYIRLKCTLKCANLCLTGVKGGVDMSTLQERSNLTISVDRPTREDFTELCDGLGLSVSSCIIALMRQAVRQQGITLSMLDENGFTPYEAAELKRRAEDVKRGHVERHELFED